MSEAISGVGTKFRRWDSVAGEWVDVSEITNITGPDKSRGTINVTNLDSIDGYMEFIAGMRDGGSVNLSMNYTRAGYDLMNDDFEDDELQNYEILLPDDTSLEFQGLVVTVPMTIPYDDKISMDVEIKVSKKVHINSGSGSGHSF